MIFPLVTTGPKHLHQRYHIRLTVKKLNSKTNLRQQTQMIFRTSTALIEYKIQISILHSKRMRMILTERNLKKFMIHRYFICTEQKEKRLVKDLEWQDRYRIVSMVDQWIYQSQHFNLNYWRVLQHLSSLVDRKMKCKNLLVNRLLYALYNIIIWNKQILSAFKRLIIIEPTHDCYLD